MAELLIAGVDEAGRGCLAGPVVAAAVILPPGFSHPLLRDSKTLSPAQRKAIFPVLLREAIAFSLGLQGPQAIDTHNILQASLLAMREAVETLPIQPTRIRVDGPYGFAASVPVEPCIQGDQRYPEIAAASILAKVLRDQLMQHLHIDYPMYGWEKNKGYPTAAHWAALKLYGPSPLHRQSFLRKGK